jgi:hypothetical protein
MAKIHPDSFRHASAVGDAGRSIRRRLFFSCGIADSSIVSSFKHRTKDRKWQLPTAIGK